MAVMEMFFVMSFLLTLIWYITRAIQREGKRKSYGKRLLIVKDITSNMDLFFGIIFLIPALRLIIMLVQGDIEFFMLTFMWPTYLAIFSIVNFVKAFSKVEIYEKGILSKDDLWEWNSAKEYSLKEESKTAVFDFKLDRRIFKSNKITVLKSDKEKVENAIEEVLRGLF